MGQQVHFNSSAQLYENDAGDLAIRFANNLVFESLDPGSGKGFVTEALEMLTSESRPVSWQMIPFRKLQHDGQNWHLISSMGFLDGDETRPAVTLEVKPEELGRKAWLYLQPDMPKTLQ